MLSSAVLRKVAVLVFVPVPEPVGIPLDTDNVVEVGIVDILEDAVVVDAPVDMCTGMGVDEQGSLPKETRLVVGTWSPVSYFLLVCATVLSYPLQSVRCYKRDKFGQRQNTGQMVDSRFMAPFIYGRLTKEGKAKCKKKMSQVFTYQQHTRYPWRHRKPLPRCIHNPRGA